MNLVGELVLARNQILQFGGRVEDASFLGASQRLNLTGAGDADPHAAHRHCLEQAATSGP